MINNDKEGHRGMWGCMVHWFKKMFGGEKSCSTDNNQNHDSGSMNNPNNRNNQDSGSMNNPNSRNNQDSGSMNNSNNKNNQDR